MIRDKEGIFQRQAERVAAVQVAAISGDNLLAVPVREVQISAIEDDTGFVGAGAFHRLHDRLADIAAQRHRGSPDFWQGRKILHWQRFDLLLGELRADGVAQGDLLLAGCFDRDVLAVRAALYGLLQFREGDEQRRRSAVPGLFESDLGGVIEVRGGKCDPAVGIPFDEEATQYGQRRAS